MSQVLRLDRPWPVEVGPIEIFSGGRRIGGFVTRIHPDGAFDVVLGAEAKRRTEAWNEPARLVVVPAPVSAPRALTVVPSPEPRLPPSSAPPSPAVLKKRRDTTLYISRPLTVPQCSKVSRPRSLVDAVLEQRQAEEMARPPVDVYPEPREYRARGTSDKPRKLRTNEEVWSGPHMAAARAKAKPGCCWFCDRPLEAAKRRKLTCGDPRCARAYQRAWRADARTERSRETGVNLRPSCEDGAP
jgi:hypothetical protein